VLPTGLAATRVAYSTCFLSLFSMTAYTQFVYFGKILIVVTDRQNRVIRYSQHQLHGMFVSPDLTVFSCSAVVGGMRSTKCRSAHLRPWTKAQIWTYGSTFSYPNHPDS